MTREAITEHEGGKYLRRILPAAYIADERRHGIDVDVYCVLLAFNVTCPARQHAIKKLLLAGNRGKGDAISDLKGAMAAINRAIDIVEQRIQLEPAKDADSLQK